MKVIRGTKIPKTDFARKLRKKSTTAEDLFWKIVRNRKLLNLKIRRQHPIGPFFADFYCHELLLVIEIDGSIHESEEIKKRDKRREQYLLQEGFRVLRFTNEDVLFNSQVIEETIKEFIQNKK
ncbi:MAG: type restriction enzyme [Bacteroidetes bacterium]|jgi:very-short-patch-repair endonuclease|nr:type restriction enzyme [Bacteroidota bacterium]